jgi:uncharacterized membrane protein
MIPHPQILFGGLMLAVTLLVGTTFWLLPNWSRPGIFFAVSVVPDFRKSPEAARVLLSYRIQALAHVVISFGLILAGAALDRAVLLILGTLWLAVGPLIALSQAHKRVVPHAVAHSTIREASLTPHSIQLLGGWLLQLMPFAILVVTGLYVSAHWNEIPDRFPVHWGINGMPNGWSTRTPVGVYGPLFCGAGLLALISLVTYGISHAARRIPASSGSTGSIDPAHRIALVLTGVEFYIAAMFALVGLLPFTGSPGATPIVILAVGIVVCTILLTKWQNRGFSDAAASLHPGDGTPDACWKLGLFYITPDDAALFVEKRIGIGYTINFARGPAWIILVVTLVLPLGLGVMATLHR